MKYIYILSIIVFIVSCNRTHRIKNANQALESKQFAIAVEMLQYDFNKTKIEEKKAVKAFLLGFAYENMNQNEASGKWYQRAYKLGFGNRALLGFIRYTIWDERYDEAISLYKTLQSRSSRTSVYRREIQQLKQALLWKSQDTLQLSFIKSMAVNSKYSDYGLTFIDDDQMIFTSDRPSSINSEGYKWTGNSYSDMYKFSRSDNVVYPWKTQINSMDNDGLAAVHPSGENIVFVRCFTEYTDEDAMCKLMLVKGDNSDREDPIVLSIVKDGFNYGSPNWNKNGDILFYSSNIRGGKGGYDIYGVSYLNGKFGLPFNLGNRINTEGNEKFPTIHRDTMYFSSDYLTGMGGLDIFKTFLRYDSTWSAPQNMLPPINSGGDDFGFVVDEMLQPSEDILSRAYFSSSRKGGIGGDDIYEYIIKPEMKVEKSKELEKIIHLVIRTTQPIYENNSGLNQLVIGKKELANVGVLLNPMQFSSDKKGLWIYELKGDYEYNLMFKKDNYFTQKLNISTLGILDDINSEDTTLFYEILMIPIRKNKEIVIDDIFYDYDKSNLRSDALPALNNLYNMLTLNPELKIELSSHTDCRGEASYNQLLSSKRAQSVVAYLMDRGIPAQRLIAKGYGMTLPVVNCACEQCTPDESQQNRRTSFKILGN